MNPIVEKAIADKEAEKRGRLNYAKTELAEKLMREDYYEREYLEGDEKSGQAWEEEKQSDGSVRYYVKKPLQLTDEEFETLRGYYGPDKFAPEKLAIVTVLQIVAWAILAVGILVGLWAGGGSIVWTVLGSVPLTVFFLALADIINRLRNIERNSKKDK